mgnify:CR=1 FL=1
MAQDGKYYWDSQDHNKIIKTIPKEESTFESLRDARNFKPSKLISDRSLAAATIQNPVSILNKKQRYECAKAYINNGIVRTVIDRSVYFIHGERTNFTIEPNEELTEGLDDVETRKLIDEVQQSPDVKELRRKVIRFNKRVQLHDACSKLLTSTFIDGRGALEVIRFANKEPRALKHLSSARIIEASVNETTGEFEGFIYEDNSTTQNRRNIPFTKLIPAFHDDNNVFDNSNYSGLSAVWPILSVAQVIDAINDEDLPEAVRQVWAKFGIMYAGTSKKSTLRKLKESLQSSTWLIHNEEGLKSEVHDLARDLMELPNVREACSKYISQCMSLPLFLLFEDTANFATANQVMQDYKAGQ